MSRRALSGQAPRTESGLRLRTDASYSSADGCDEYRINVLAWGSENDPSSQSGAESQDWSDERSIVSPRAVTAPTTLLPPRMFAAPVLPPLPLPLTQEPHWVPLLPLQSEFRSGELYAYGRPCEEADACTSRTEESVCSESYTPYEDMWRHQFGEEYDGKLALQSQFLPNGLDTRNQDLSPSTTVASEGDFVMNIDEDDGWEEETNILPHGEIDRNIIVTHFSSRDNLLDFLLDRFANLAVTLSYTEWQWSPEYSDNDSDLD